MVNNNEHKYVNCYCCLMNVKTATLLIAIFTLLGGLYNIATMPTSPLYPEYKNYLGLINASWSFAAFLAIIAVGLRVHYVLIPFLAVLTFSLAAVTVSFICLLLLFAMGALYPRYMSGENVGLWVTSMFVTGMSLPITYWFLVIVKCCYCHLKERRNSPDVDVLPYVSN